METCRQKSLLISYSIILIPISRIRTINMQLHLREIEDRERPDSSKGNSTSISKRANTTLSAFPCSELPLLMIYTNVL